MPLSTAEKKKIVETYGIGDNDTGSTFVQVAMLTENIRQLTGHMKENHKDYASRRGLLKMVARRRRLLRYLGKVNEEQYKDLIGRLGLKR